MRYQIKVGGEDLGVWDLDELSLRDSFALKEVTGLDPLMIQLGLKSLNPGAWAGVIWYLRRKRNPKIRIDQIDFTWGDVEADELPGETVPPPGAETAGDGTSAAAEMSGSTSSPASSATAPPTSTA